MHARTWLAPIVFLLVAGCAAPAPPSLSNAPESSAALAQQAELAVLAHEGPPMVNVTRWSNGSFQAYETCNVTGCVTGTAFHDVDLSDAFPATVPVRFRIELIYESNPLFRRPMVLELVTEGASLYNVSEILDREGTVLTGVLLRGTGTVHASILYASPVYGSGTTVPYAMRVDVRGGNGWTPGGVPLLVSLAHGTEAVATASYGSADAAVFAPDNAPLGRWTAGPDGLLISLPEGQPAGDYVFVFPETTEAVQFRSNHSQATIRALPVVMERGEPHSVQGLEPVVWSFNLDQPPLLVGLYEANEQVVIAESSSSPVEVRSPAGVVLEGTLGCDGLCVTGAYEVMIRSDAVHPALVAGAYEARYEPTGSVGVHVGHFVLRYER